MASHAVLSIKRPRRSSAKPRHYNPLPKKAPLLCLLCRKPTAFVDNHALDAHLHKAHPDWFQKALRNLYVKMHPLPSEL